MINKYLSCLLILFIVISCDSSIESNQDNLLKNNISEGVDCEYTIDEKGHREGKYECFYSNGILKEVGFLKSDTVKIYENLLFYPSGELQKYSFYNPLGELRFQRIYNKVGDLVNELGDFLSHDELSNAEMNLGDSSVLKIFVATPPNVVYKIYGIGSKGRYEMTFDKTEVGYSMKKIIYGKKKGDYVFPYEVEVLDKSTGKTIVRKSDVSFKVILPSSLSNEE